MGKANQLQSRRPLSTVDVASQLVRRPRESSAALILTEFQVVVAEAVEWL